MNGFIGLAIALAGIGTDAGSSGGPCGILKDMAIQPVDPSKAPVVVTREFLAPGRINPFQYGQFIEYLCNLVPGMW